MTYATNTDVYKLEHWSRQQWVKDLLQTFAEVLSLCERYSGGFHYDYCLTIKLQDGTIRHRWFQRHNWNYNNLADSVSEALNVYMRMNNGEPNLGLSSAWLDGVPHASMVRCALNRNNVGAESREQILEAHGGMMLSVMRKFLSITHIGKRANVTVSPRTFMFVRKNMDTVSVCTWMADPSAERVAYRMKSRAQRDRWAHYDGEKSKDALECSHIFTRAEVFAHAGEEDVLLKKQEALQAEIAADEAQQQRASEAMQNPADDIGTPPLDSICSGCGCSLKTNISFGRGEGMVCGECELKAEAEQGTERTVQRSLVFARRRVYEKLPSKFDPRPGIDDRGAWSSPSWEEDYS